MTTFYRVEQGNFRRWFATEEAAREWANERFDTELDGIPFITEYTLSEAVLKINELEARVAGEASLTHAPA
jgi:hypothetical protein